MFKLVGDQEFTLGTTPCLIRIEPVSGFSYQYSLLVDGKPLSEFTKQRSTSVCTWVVEPDHRVVLGKLLLHYLSFKNRAHNMNCNIIILGFVRIKDQQVIGNT